QMLYNTENGITPKTVIKDVSDILEDVFGSSEQSGKSKKGRDIKKIKDDLQLISHPDKMKTHIEKLEKDMRKAAADLEFEEAAKIRDEINRLETVALSL
ncbi:MAG: UvrB/UvrC motif-containing protein, partial [Pseudomonadota bacterium]|nr:UvrB/UvrC motif-containing protein [Pseudomonadota bacterium]